MRPEGLCAACTPAQRTCLVRGASLRGSERRLGSSGITLVRGVADTMVPIPLNCGVQLIHPSVAHTCPSWRTLIL